MRNSLSQNVVIGPKKMVLKFHCLPALRSRLGFIKIITIDIKSVDIFFSLKIYRILWVYYRYRVPDIGKV